MHQWPGGKATQKVVVYPIPRHSWESKIDGAQTNENVQEYLHHPENDVVVTADQQIKASTCIVQVDSQQRKLTDKEFNALKEQLDAQLKVNADLKKLLIASLGDDLQCKVDVLVRTKAHLTNEVSSYTNKMLEDFENIDKLTVETNLWRTKFQASCVLLNLLTSEKNKMEEAFLRSQNSLQTLLDERRQINSMLVQTNNQLNCIRSTLFPLKRHNLSDAGPGNTVELAESNSSLVEIIYDLLHGDRRSTSDLPSPSNRLTFAEALATEVLSNRSETTAPSGSDICSIVQSSKTFMGTTFNCCRKCKGQIMNV